MSSSRSMFSHTKHGVTQDSEAVQELRELPIEMIEPNPSQPRRYFDETALEALAGSVRERGVLQPVLVRPRSDGSYELVAGERRWRAAKIAGLETIPALVSVHDDAATLEVALIENMARKDLNPIEEARACATLVKELGLTQQQIGRRVGRSNTAVSNLMRLLKLSGELIELLERGELSEGHGKALLTAKDPEVRSQMARAAIQEGWTVRTLEARAARSNDAEPGSKPARRNELEAAALNVATAWGDVLGVEVGVRPLRGRQLRVEVAFTSPEAALAAVGRLEDAGSPDSGGS